MAEPGTPGAPPPPEAFDPAELNRQAAEVLGRITPETHLTETRHIMAEAVAEAGGRTDNDGALLLPPDVHIQAVYEDSTEGGEPRVMVAVGEWGSDEAEQVPVAEFRTRYQDPHAESGNLRPYRAINGVIAPRTDDAPYGPRSAEGTGSDLPPETRRRWAELGGERDWQKPGLQTAFDHMVLRDSEPFMGAVVHATPQQRGELQEMLDVLEPDERREIVDGVMSGLSEDYLHWEGRTPTETLDTFPRVADELQAVSEWNPEFRRGLREGLAAFSDEDRQRLESVAGVEFDYSQTPFVVRSRNRTDSHNRGRMLNPWHTVQLLRRELPRSGHTAADDTLTVEAMDNVVDYALGFAQQQSAARLRPAGQETGPSQPEASAPISVGQQLIQRDSGDTWNVVRVGDRGDGKVLVGLQSPDGTKTVSKAYDDLEAQLGTEGAAWHRPDTDDISPPLDSPDEGDEYIPPFLR